MKNVTTHTRHWYEAYKPYGKSYYKVMGIYSTEEEAHIAVHMAEESDKKCDYNFRKYFIMCCTSVYTTDDDGCIVSETITKVKV